MLFLALAFMPIDHADSERLAIKTYTTAEGLARDRVTRIRKDSRGFLWFCTEEGLSRFDGYRFTNYSTSNGLPSSSVFDFLEASDGTFWVGTLKGLCRFNPYVSAAGTKEAGRYNTDHRMFIPYQPDDGQETVFSALFEDTSGTIWCGSSRGIYRLERDGGDWRLREENIKAAIYNFIEDRQGALWIATDRALCRRLRDGTVEFYTQKNGLPSSFIRGLLETRDGSIWVGTTMGLCQLKREISLDKNIVSRVIYRFKGALIGGTWLLETPNGHIWVCAGQGLFEVVPEKESYRLKHYEAAQGLSGNFLWAIIEDTDGNPWIASNTGGVMKMARNGLTTWRADNGLNAEFVMGICEDRAGDLCVTSRSPEGLLISRLDGEEFKTTRPFYPKAVFLRDDEAQQGVLQDHTGEWWIPTASGLVRYGKTSSVEQLARTPPKAVYTTKDGLGANHVFRLFEDSRGDIWVGSFIGSSASSVTRWERQSETFHQYSFQNGAPVGTPSGFAEDQSGNIWVAFHSGYVARYKDGRFQSYQVASPPPGRRMHDIYSDRAGRVWVGTAEEGVFEIDNPNDAQPQFTNYSVKEGLSSDAVWDITEDDLGNIYFGTGRGLDRLNPATKQIKHYTTVDGLTSNYVLMVWRDRRGAIWAGTQKGVSRLIPEPDRPTHPPPVFISSIRIAGEKYPVAELGEASISVPDLTSIQDQLNIDFFGLSLAVGEQLRYQYKLEGGGGEWSESSERRSVDFANLKPGSYRFLVRAINSDGTVSSQPASATFKILPPIWMRWWFIGLISLLSAAVAFAVIKQRTARRREREQAEDALRQAKEERLRELEQVRRHIAADLHDDIGSNLTRISLISEVAQRKLDGADPPVREHLSSIAKLSRELVDSMSEIVWAINPNRDHLADLSQRMRHFASDLLTARQINFHFRVLDFDGDIKVGANVRREFFLIFKEGVNNIARHSACTEADIELHADGDNLVLTLNDNGKGFDANEKRSGHGLMSMRERTRLLGGRLEIDSAPGRGASLKFTVPLHTHQQD